MSYEPTIWECGDVVTAERLNHMEEGIEAANACCEGGGVVLEATSVREATVEECPSGGTVIEYNHTWQEVHDAVLSGIMPIFNDGGEYIVITRIMLDDSSGYTALIDIFNILSPTQLTLTATSANSVLKQVSCVSE